MGICSHPPIARRRQRRDLRSEPSCFPEQLLRLVAAHPLLEQPQVSRIFPHHVDRNLMGAPKSFDLLAVDLLRTSPAFWAPQNDERPVRRSHSLVVRTGLAGLLLNVPDM